MRLGTAAIDQSAGVTIFHVSFVHLHVMRYHYMHQYDPIWRNIHKYWRYNSRLDMVMRCHEISRYHWCPLKTPRQCPFCRPSRLGAEPIGMATAPFAWPSRHESRDRNTPDMEVSSFPSGNPNSWRVYFMFFFKIKWTINLGYPHFRKPMLRDAQRSGIGHRLRIPLALSITFRCFWLTQWTRDDTRQEQSLGCRQRREVAGWSWRVHCPHERHPERIPCGRKSGSLWSLWSLWIANKVVNSNW